MKMVDYVIFPRKLKSDYLEGKITRNEFFTYSWLRLSANPYSICIISLSDIKNDVLKGRVSENYVNKILLSLKSKKYIHYSNRKGRRGSFEVHIGDFLLASGKISNLDHLFEQEKVRGLNTTTTTNKSEVKPEVESASQRLNEQKNQLNKHLSMPDNNERVRGDNNDNDNNNNNDIIDSKSNLNNSCRGIESNNKVIPVNGYMPESYEKEECWRIAKWLEESDMRFILSIYEKHGLAPIQRAWNVIKEITEENPNKIEDKRKYFNKLVRDLIIK